MAKIFSRRNDHLGRSILKALVDSDNGDDIFSLYSTEYGSIEHPAYYDVHSRHQKQMSTT